MKLNLKNVTLICVDGDPDHNLIINSIFNSVCKKIDFHDQIHIKNIKSLYDYNEYVHKHLHNDIKSDYVLIAQWDGYPLKPTRWDDKWFEYDYIGAVWHNHHHFKNKVGNGGFCLRTKEFAKEMSKRSYDPNVPEDVHFCVKEPIDGMKYASIEVADKFAVEDKLYNNQFGFHGIKTIMMNKFLAEIYSKINHPLINYALNNECRLTLNECCYIEALYKKDPENFNPNLKL